MKNRVKIEPKQKLRKIITMLMVGVMCISLMGCEKKANKRSSEEDTYYQLSMECAFDYVFDNSVINGGFLYGSYRKENKRSSSNQRENNYEYGIVKYDLETNEKKEVLIETDGMVDSLYFASEESICVRMRKQIEGDNIVVADIDKEEDEAGTEDVATEEDEAGTEDIEEGGAENTGEDENELQYIAVVLTYNTDLELLSESEMDINTENVRSTVIDDEGDVFKIIRNKNEICYLRIDDQDGTIKNTIDIGQAMEGTSLMKLSDGQIVLKKVAMPVEYYYIDKNSIDSNGLKQSDQMEGLGNTNNITQIFAGNDNNLLINSNDGYLNLYDINEKKREEVLRYLDSDIDPYTVTFAFIKGENQYGVLTVNYSEGKSELDSLTKQKKSEMAEKKEIVYGAFAVSNTVKEKIFEFNKRNDEYKIVIKEYYEDLSKNNNYVYGLFESIDKDVIDGNIPDIIDLQYFDVSKYAKHDVLEDLMPYIQRDAELKEEDFVGSVLEAYKVDGKLYALPTRFAIYTFAGNGEETGYDISWTTEEFIKYSDSLPEGKDIFDYATKENVLNDLLIQNKNDYIDWNKGKCYFDSDTFVDVLKFCDNFILGRDYKVETISDDGTVEAESTKIANGKIALEQVMMTSVYDYLESKVVFGENMAYKGYPTKEGNGVAVTTDMMFSISSKSKYKDVAWDFIKQFYTYEEQLNDEGYLSIRQDLMDEALEDLKNIQPKTTEDGMTYYYRDELEDGKYLYVESITDEDIEKIRNLIKSVDRVGGEMDGMLGEIIWDESEVFFEGKKSAEEVADIIQSRASIYVNENS